MASADKANADVRQAMTGSKSRGCKFDLGQLRLGDESGRNMNPQVRTCKLVGDA